MRAKVPFRDRATWQLCEKSTNWPKKLEGCYNFKIMDEEKKISQYSFLLTASCYLFIFSILHFLFLYNTKNIPFSRNDVRLQVSMTQNMPLVQPNLKKSTAIKKTVLNPKILAETNAIRQKSAKIDPENNEITLFKAGAIGDTITNSNDSDSELNFYFSRIYQKIKQHEYYPDSERAQEHKGKVKLSFTVLKNGIIQEIKILQKCPYEKLNKAAKETVAMAGPFTQIPDNIEEEKLTFTIELEYKL